MLSLRRSILRTQRPSMICNSLRRSVFDWQIPAAVASLGVIGVSLLRAYPQLKEVKRDVGEPLPEGTPPALDKANCPKLLEIKYLEIKYLFTNTPKLDAPCCTSGFETFKVCLRFLISLNFSTFNQYFTRLITNKISKLEHMSHPSS